MTRVALIVADGADVDSQWLLEYAGRTAAQLDAELVGAEAPAPSAALVVFQSGAGREPRPAVPPAVPSVWVDLAEAARPLKVSIAEDVPVIRGRGIEGVRWGLAQVVRHAAAPPTRMRYGEGRDRFLDLRVPTVGEPPHPAALLLHGGFWRERWTLDTIEPLAVDLTERGFVSCNVEYRRVGASGGGWPMTDEDAASALRFVSGGLPDLVDPARIVVVGHSAGAQLAVAAAAAVRSASVRPGLVVSLAGVLDLRLCALRGLGDTGNAAAAYTGAAAADAGSRFAVSSPVELVPLGLAQLVVQGVDDSPDLIEMSRRYVAHARAAGDEVEYLELPGDHFGVITPTTPIWREAAERIERVRTGAERPDVLGLPDPV
jgi:acetyl esterase/lipase